MGSFPGTGAGAEDRNLGVNGKSMLARLGQRAIFDRSFLCINKDEVYLLPGSGNYLIRYTDAADGVQEPHGIEVFKCNT